MCIKLNRYILHTGFMKTILITSDKFTGAIELQYDDSDYLVKYDATGAELDEKQKVLFLKYMPRDDVQLTELLNRFSNLKSTVIVKEVTFDDFWRAWFKDRPKDNSSKKRSELRWNKMNKREQLKAFQYIPAYMGKVKPGTEPKYAETYLNSEVWH